MKKVFLVPVLMVIAVGFLGSVGQPEDSTVVTLAYNRFLNMSFSDSPSPIVAIQDAVKSKHPEIEVQLNITPDSIEASHDTLAVWMTSKDPTIDIYGMDTPWVLEFGKAEWALPLNDKVPELSSDFVAGGVDIFSYQGQQLGVPFWGSIAGLYYRTDLLQEYGFSGPPESLDEMVRMIETIQSDRPELTGFCWPGNRAEALIMVWADFLYAYGGDYKTSAGNWALNGRASTDAVSFLKTSIDSGYSPKEVISWDAEEARNRFVEGNAIFLWHNGDLVQWLDDPERSKVAGNWDFVQSPKQPGGTSAAITGGFAFAANPYSDTPEATIKVLRVIASREVQKAFAMAWGPVQYYKGLYDDPEVKQANKNSDKLTAVLPYAKGRPQTTNYAQLSSVLQQEIHSALAGQKSIRDALNEAQKQAEIID